MFAVSSKTTVLVVSSLSFHTTKRSQAIKHQVRVQHARDFVQEVGRFKNKSFKFR